MWSSTCACSAVPGASAGEDAPFAAKLVAAASLFLWLGVMYWGRMLLFIGDFL
jgi:hypothetical protein